MSSDTVRPIVTLRRTQRGVQSLETAGAILDALARAPAPVMLRDLAEALGIAASQLHPYLVSLRAIRLVEQTDRGLYTLGPFALELGLSRLRLQNAHHTAIRRVGTLVEELGLMVAITVWGLHGPTIVYVEESPERIHANVQPGGIFRLTNTATGALFAAFHNRRAVDPVLQAELQALPDPRAREVETEALRQRVAAVLNCGYATTKDRPIPGVSAVAAPVFDHSNAMKLAITLIGPTGTIRLEPEEPPVRRVVEFTRSLSRDLGWNGTLPNPSD